MSLIKSKQIRSLDAIQVNQTDDMQFVSASDKANFSDKYTKKEVDDKLTDARGDVSKQITDITTSITNVNTKIDEDVKTINATTVDLQNQINTNNTTITNEITDINTSITKVDTKIDDDVKTINATTSDLQNQINVNNTNITKQITDINTSITNVDTKVDEDIKTINATTTDLQNQINVNNTTITNQITDINTSITKVDTKIDEDVKAINSTTADLQSQITVNNNTLTNEIQTVNTSLQNQITSAIQGLSWKSPVDTFADIAKVYPNPAEGWVLTVDDTNKVYRYDAPTSKWVEFPIQAPTTYVKTITINPSIDNQTSIDTGIRNDNTGIYKTGHSDVVLKVNGCAQIYGADKDYTADFVNNDLIITWTNRQFSLETSDELDITYTHFELV
ncbi:hypothetical protein [Clostridium acetobutylicum]|uniref:hypothetical protein n=1 Tax=Clostridium acetobutylicum TaxID=1488 RepID=UPI00098C47DA|nr:hypothetical protein [Clostridium acetobutylicum]OOM05121.1 hypothetical protein CLABU_26510 [Clostridium acetobutylicum]